VLAAGCDALLLRRFNFFSELFSASHNECHIGLMKVKINKIIYLLQTTGLIDVRMEGPKSASNEKCDQILPPVDLFIMQVGFQLLTCLRPRSSGQKSFIYFFCVSSFWDALS
jgi:hypothetical protein